MAEHEFEIVERTEPLTIEEVFDFIDDTSIGKMDAHELKSRIANLTQEARAEAIDEFAKKLIINFSDWQMSLAEVGNEREYETIQQAIDGILEIAEQLKEGGK